MPDEKMSVRTSLAWEGLTAEVGLIKTTGKGEDAPEFVKAGPHGKPLERAAVKDGKRMKLEKTEAGEKVDGVLGALTSSVERIQGKPGTVQEDKDDPLSVPAMAKLPPVENPPQEVEVGIVEVGYDEELREEDVRRGFVVPGEDGPRFYDVTEQLASIAEETKTEELRIAGFIRRERVPRIMVQGSYYLAAAGPGAPKVLRLLWLAMRDEGRAAVVKWTKRTRQALGVLTPAKDGSLVVLELAWPDELREPGERARFHINAEVTPGELAAARDLMRATAKSPELIAEQSDDRVRLESELVTAALMDDLEQFLVPEKPAVAEDASVEQALRDSIPF